LFYVGTAPRDESSQAKLRSRILRQHIGGNTGSSTFRFTLASLLFESMEWPPVLKNTKTVLLPDDNKTLSAWQQEKLRLTWAVHDAPWSVEPIVIGRLEPPLNLAGNATHPFYDTVSSARARFRSAPGS
jgi:hypothetical protein